MNRPWQIWGAFAVCLAALLGAMGWMTHVALGLEASERQARWLAAREENVRLALWRMESALAPLIAEESGRSFQVYSPFYTPPQVYGGKGGSLGPEDLLIPSPLLTAAQVEVRLHFQIGPDGVLTSPQAPSGELRALAGSGYVAPEQLAAADALLNVLRNRVDGAELRASLGVQLGRPIEEPAQVVFGDWQVEGPAGQQQQQQLASSQQQQAEVPGNAPAEWPQTAAQQQRARNYNEFNARAMQNVSNSLIAANVAASGREVVIGAMEPTWHAEDLLLVRNVTVAGRHYVQGCWLDWDALRERLLAGVADLLPKARLEPVRALTPAPDPQVLAALPVRLDPGTVVAATQDGVSAIRVSLGIAWVCAMLAALAVAILLRGAVALSERRAAFVSAVTHEMRTPLTTFGIYTDMLLRDMVPTPEKQKAYLKTLRAEAQRLVHLVENVLTSARLERRPERIQTSPIAIGAVLERMQGRLSGRAAEAGMRLDWSIPAELADQQVAVDASALEQILFNLVDNACKYAAQEGEPVIHVEVERWKAGVAVVVRDHGPGLAGVKARGRFRPFGKSAQEAANSAPGVGLGLALSRRLARHMGGDVVVDPSYREGARIAVQLAAARH